MREGSRGMICLSDKSCLLVLLTLSQAAAQLCVAAERWPSLPAENSAVMIPAQEWPLRPGPRTVKLLVHYPGGRLDRVNARSGLMLSLHNWGGTGCTGTAAPNDLPTLSTPSHCASIICRAAIRRRLTSRMISAISRRWTRFGPYGGSGIGFGRRITRTMTPEYLRAAAPAAET